MSSRILPKSVLVSFLAHTVLVSSLSFSLFPGSVLTRQPRLSFLGGMMPPALVQSPQFEHSVSALSVLPEKKAGPLPRTLQAGLFTLPQVYVKPQGFASGEPVKALTIPSQPLIVSLPKRKDPAIMFHPLLPYQLQLYFKDRQAVHIELEFSIIPGNQTNSILVKRKISSGNLEADLLSARYMQHYLFIQQARFSPHRWQTVKIDLSTKND